jgi:uncharacterized protein YndB with AHSA1/START domain
MKWIFITLALLTGLGVLLTLIGLILPRTHQATSQVELRQPIDSVWAVIRALGETPAFWSELKSASRLADSEGKETWGQTMKNGFTLPLVIEEESPPHRLVTRIAAPPGTPFGGQWIYQLEQVSGGTRVSVTEDGWVSNPFFRVISRIMGYHTTLDSYLKALAKKFGERAAPTHRD